MLEENTPPGFPERAAQLKWFTAQVAIASSSGQPLYLHERLAHELTSVVLSIFWSPFNFSNFSF